MAGTTIESLAGPSSNSLCMVHAGMLPTWPCSCNIGQAAYLLAGCMAMDCCFFARQNNMPKMSELAS